MFASGTLLKFQLAWGVQLAHACGLFGHEIYLCPCNYRSMAGKRNKKKSSNEEPEEGPDLSCLQELSSEQKKAVRQILKAVKEGKGEEEYENVMQALEGLRTPVATRRRSQPGGRQKTKVAKNSLVIPT